MSTGADVLVHEREPDDRHVPDVEDDRRATEAFFETHFTWRATK